MPLVRCEFCKNEFKKKKSQQLLHPKNFCSRYCSQQGSKKGEIFSCTICNKMVYKSLKDIQVSKSKNYFCSRTCANEWIGKQQRGPNHSNWVDGGHSYKIAMRREGLLQSCFLCKENDVRVLAVHHIDKNRKNNKFINLVCLCHNCHFLVHHYKEVTDTFNQKIKRHDRS